MLPSTFLRRGLLGAGLLLSSLLPAQADWTTFDLPALNGYSTIMAHRSDGTLIYGTSNDLDFQTAFQTSGPISFGQYTNVGGGNSWDPSAISLFSNTLGVIGEGKGVASSIYVFDPSNLATPFTAIPNVTLQNYNVLFRDATGLYVGGGNGSQTHSGGSFNYHSVNYVSLNGDTNKIIIDNISLYSGAMAVDLAGNLYVTDYDDGKLYKFTAAQLSAAIAPGGSVLALTDGTFLTTLPGTSSLAVDELGRIWSTGYMQNGLTMFDPQNGLQTSFVPNLANTNYSVTTFSDGVDDYVGFVVLGGFSPGSAVTYGFEKVQNLIPEPSTGLLLLGGIASLGWHRRRSWASLRRS